MKAKVKDGVYWHGLAPGTIFEISNGEFKRNSAYLIAVSTEGRPDTSTTREELETKSYMALKALAKAHGLDTSGKKKDLIERILDV